jgi:hypothetical protein
LGLEFKDWKFDLKAARKKGKLGEDFSVGGMANGKPYIPSYSYMFKGCMKKVGLRIFKIFF